MGSSQPPPIPAPRTSGRVGDLYYAAYGDPEAPPLVVLHGGPGASHDYLLPQMLHLANQHRLIFYDQRGGGQSRTDDPTPVTWRTHVDDLQFVIHEFGLDSPVIVGYSWGAMLALLYSMESAAGRVTPMPSRLALIDPAPLSRTYREQFEAEFARRQESAQVLQLRTELAHSGLRESDPDAYRHRAFELSVAGYFADPRRARDLTAFRVTARVQKSVWESLGDFDLLAPGQIDSIHLPALVTHGRQDPIPLASSEGCARALSAQLVVLDQCGHVPYVEQPRALFAALDPFLA